MKLSLFLLLTLIVCGLISTAAQSIETGVSFISILATPERFDGKLITVEGYLVLGEHPEWIGQEPFLYVHQEDAQNLLPNSVGLIPTSEMRRNREKIDHVYVRVTGTFHAAHGSNNAAFEPGTISDIQSCERWSNPDHPIGLKSGSAKYK